MKKILVTGGAGLVGSHLCEKLLEQENKIICLDNLSTSSKQNIKNLLKNPNFSFIKKDVTKKISIEIDEIYNLACPASPKHYQINPVKTIITCVTGSINMLELAKKNNAKILQASTSEIYGDPEEHPQKETYWGKVNPIGIRSCYDEGKRCAETLFFDYNRQYKINTKVARIFNTYGPNMTIDDGRVVSNFIISALLNKNINIYGKGNQTRSFCYVSDLIDGLIKFMNTKNTIKGPINIGNPNEFTINDLAKKILKITKSKSKISFMKLPLDDPKQRRPNIKKAKKDLGWIPKIDLDEGIEKTVNYFKKKLFI